MSQQIAPVSLLKMEGTLTVRVRDRRGRTLKTVRKRNTITYSAGTVVRALLCQRLVTNPNPAAAEYSLRSMRFGTDNTAPARSQSDLISEISAVRKELTEAQMVDDGTGRLSLQATLQTADGNGNTFQEAGVFTLGSGLYSANQGGTVLMFARQVHAPLAKTSSVSFDYDWVFEFTT